MWSKIIKQQKTKVDISDIGLYLKLITMDVNPKNNKELALMISDEFNVRCTEKDIEVYNALHVENPPEDYEKLSRMVEFNIEYNIE